jgi:hypothetical protein
LTPGRLASAFRAIIWVLGGVMVVGLSTIGVTTATLPGCTLCHSSAKWVQQTSASTHADIACARCHVSPGVASRLTFASREVFGMALRISPVSGRADAAVRDDTCLSCHRPILDKVVRANGLSIDHSKCAKGSLCSDCHSGVAHGSSVPWRRVVEMDRCLACHSTDRVSSACDTCHAAKSGRERLGLGTWAVTHGASWKTTHGMGDWETCGACHPKDYCVPCHGLALPHSRDFLTLHPAEAAASQATCRACHKSAFCDGCHGVEMPHPAAFTPLHADLVRSKGEEACLRCHDETDCSDCHAKHVHPGGATLRPGGSQ